MKTLRFILEKIVIVEVMLIILFMACNWFGVHITLIDMIINTGLKYLTSVSIIALIGYIVLSFFGSRFVQVVLGIVIGGIILYYLVVYVL